MLYDLFICHASEDKASFVRPLADTLRSENVAVWYDEFTLKIGDSIRRAIDKGLKKSRFAVVVLSPAFFQKQWTQYELDGLVEREMRGADKVILPIWHGVTHDDVMAYSPSLAGRIAANSCQGMATVVDALMDVVRPQGSPLIAAREMLLDWGITPPVITDEYWLNVVEASNRVPGFGASVPEEATWNFWSFPLPPKGDTAEEWGERIAWTAMQSAWVKVAQEQAITLISHPSKVLRFIDEQPGLFETCSDYPTLVAEYAPQLIIRGFGGRLEPIIDAVYQSSCDKHHKSTDTIGGSGLTTTKKPPLCHEGWALRHPTFADYEADHVAAEYFSGGIFGPSVSPYQHADHLFWLLSTDSEWMPSDIRNYLIKGMSDWSVWHWGHFDSDKGGEWKSNGQLAKLLFNAARTNKVFRLTADSKDDLRNRISVSIDTLKLSDSVDNICDLFMRRKFPQGFINSRKDPPKRKRTQKK